MPVIKRVANVQPAITTQLLKPVQHVAGGLWC